MNFEKERVIHATRNKLNHANDSCQALVFLLRIILIQDLLAGYYLLLPFSAFTREALLEREPSSKVDFA